MPSLLECAALRFGYSRRRDFLGPVSLAIEPGRRWAIVGPNGAGKSTLLRLLAGLLRPAAGRILCDGLDLRELPLRRRARLIGFLPQHPPQDLASTAREVVLMGRFPHRRLGLFETADDHRLAQQAMTLTRTAELADRPLFTLSGGEAQRVHLAAAIAQAPRVLLLDEPTSSLDLQHQLAVIHTLNQLAARENCAVIMVNHDVNLAMRFSTDVLLLHAGRVVAAGPPDKVLTPEVLRPVYEVPLVNLSSPDAPGLRCVVAAGAAL